MFFIVMLVVVFFIFVFVLCCVVVVVRRGARGRKKYIHLKFWLLRPLAPITSVQRRWKSTLYVTGDELCICYGALLQSPKAMPWLTTVARIRVRKKDASVACIGLSHTPA